MDRFIDFWNYFWFEGGGSLELAIARILIVGYFLFVKLPENGLDLRAWRKAYHIFHPVWQKPWLGRKLDWTPGGNPQFLLLLRIYKAALLFTVIGFLTQVSAFVAFLLGLYLMSIRHGIRTHHTVIPIHFCLLAFWVAPSGDALSVDILWKSYLGVQASGDEALYTWAVRLIQVVFAMVVFATGYAKIKHWRTGFFFWQKGHLSDLLRLHDYPFFFVRPLLSLSKPLKASRFLEFVAAFGTVIVELLFPLVLLFPIAKIFFVPAFMAMIVGFRISIGARFDFFNVILIAVFVPWSLIFGIFPF